jgi:hypothetical protein
VCTTSPIALGLMSRIRRGGGRLSLGDHLARQPRVRRVPLAQRQRVGRGVLRVLAHAPQEPLDRSRRRPTPPDAVDVDHHRHRSELRVLNDEPVRALRVELREPAVFKPAQRAPEPAEERVARPLVVRIEVESRQQCPGDFLIDDQRVRHVPEMTALHQ